MEIAACGSLRIRHGGREWCPTAPADRRFLAELIAHAGRTVSTGHLVDAMWPHRRPSQPANAVQIRASRLRRALRDLAPELPPDEVLRTTAHGYELRTDTVDVDVVAYRAAVAEASVARRAGAPERAAEAYAVAIAAWRAGPFDTAPQTACVAEEAARLEESYVAAVEEHADLCAAVGRPVAVDVAEIGRLVAAHPLRERLLAALMTALDRTGQRGAALAAYRAGRQRLVGELGVEPGPALRELHATILRGEAGPVRPFAGGTDGLPGGSPGPRSGRNAGAEPAASGPGPVHCLPRDLPDFTGREPDLHRVVAAVQSPGADLVVIGGLAGVGKTSLAVHVAHRLADRYPDGELYVDLCGHTPGRHPVEPAAALRLLLASLGVPPDRIPHGLEARAARWRAELAGRRVLLLLDNAVSAEQVRPLLPGMPGCTAMVTARASLPGLDGAALVPLDVLPARESVALLGAVAGADRVADDPVSAAQTAELCGHLPLAIRLVGARLRQRTGWTVRDAAEHLRNGRLAALSTGPHAVTAAFALSLRDLDELDTGAFELASLTPGTTFSADLVAAAAGQSTERADAALQRLVDAYLVEQPVAGRYRFHDLLRDYARDRTAALPAQARHAAVARMLDQLLATAVVAVSHLGPRARTLPFAVTPPPARGPALHGRDHAAAWLDTEHDNLIAAIEYAYATGHDRHAWQLAEATYRHFLLGGHNDDWIRVNQSALRAARRLADRRAEGRTLLDLGLAEGLRARAPQALDHLDRALSLVRAAGDTEAEQQALLALGNVHVNQWRYREAISFYRQVVDRAGDADQSRALALALGNLGLLLGRLGRHREAGEFHHRALRAAQAANDRYRECHELANLADLDLQLGDVRAARARYGEALTLARAVGEHHGEVHALSGLALVHRRLGRYDEAVHLHQQALRLGHRADNRNREAAILNQYATTVRQAGRPEEAGRLYGDALRLAGESGNPYEEALALRGLAGLADPAQADHYHSRAAAILARLGVPSDGEPHLVPGLPGWWFGGGPSPVGEQIQGERSRPAERGGADALAIAGVEILVAAGPAYQVEHGGAQGSGD
jgi:DNA-binding SARP family transcriptional activator/tetratricopeptide (TPR) repeat protein